MLYCNCIASVPQPRYQEVVDRMVGQLVRLLWQEERRGNGRYRCAPPLQQPPPPPSLLQPFPHALLRPSCAEPIPLSPPLPPPPLCSIVVTGDHSTPVEFGDHSHEPVPFAIAHLRHVVS